MTDEPKKNHWYEMYELECLKTKELEKENAELKKRNAELRGMYVHSAREAGTYKQFLEAKEKENAELKDYRLITVAKQQTDLSKYALNLEHKLSWYDDQLTKAKEIIKDLLSLCEGETDSKLVFTRAEQFLKE